MAVITTKALLDLSRQPLARVLGWTTALALLAGLGAAFFYAPPDAVQGNVQRIMYIHVPSAWLSFFSFGVVAFASLFFLWRGHPEWDILARSAAEIGVVFTGLALVTGSIWGKPTWGTWWTWDARLTTTFILFFIYLGYLMLRAFAQDSVKGARVAAVVGIIGFLDVPLIHVSVEWWRTLHQASSFHRPEGPAVATPMLLTLFVNLLAFTLLFGYLLVQKTAIEAARDEAVRRKRGEPAPEG